MGFASKFIWGREDVCGEKGGEPVHALRTWELHKAYIQFFRACLTVFLMKNLGVYFAEVFVLLTSIF